jgi:LacI family transcriptional regulator
LPNRFSKRGSQGLAALTRGRITIAGVARRAGVAKSTVSAVVRDNARVGAPTRARVLRAAEELGYRPGRTAAQALSATWAPRRSSCG